MISVGECDTGPPQFNDLISHRLKRSEIELALTVIPVIGLCFCARLKSIGANDRSVLSIADEQMIANLVKLIYVQSCGQRAAQAFFELQIEDLETKSLSCAHVF